MKRQWIIAALWAGLVAATPVVLNAQNSDRGERTPGAGGAGGGTAGGGDDPARGGTLGQPTGQSEANGGRTSDTQPNQDGDLNTNPGGTNQSGTTNPGGTNNQGGTINQNNRAGQTGNAGQNQDTTNQDTTGQDTMNQDMNQDMGTSNQAGGFQNDGTEVGAGVAGRG